MTVGIHELARSIANLRIFLENTLSPQLMAQIVRTMTTIQDTLGSKDLQQSIRLALNNFNDFMKDMGKENVVGKASELMDKIKILLSSIDSKQLSNIIRNLEDLLVEAREADMIPKIVESLAAVSSIGELAKKCAELAGYAGYMSYGYIGYKMGMTILTIIQSRRKEGDMEKLIGINLQQLSIQIQSLRIQCSDHLLNVDKFKLEFPDRRLPERLLQIIIESENILRATDPISSDSLESVNEAKRIGEDIFRNFYKDELKRAEKTRYFDRMHKIDEHIIEYIIYSSQYKLMSKLKKPELPGVEICTTYARIRNLYGGEFVDAIMRDLIGKFKENGGAEIREYVVNSYDDAAETFCEVMNFIRIENFEYDTLDDYLEFINKFAKFYHIDAIKFVKTEWVKKDGRSVLEEHYDIVSRIIRDRSLAEYCLEISPYLFAPFNVPREIINGLADFPKGIYTMIRHPIKSAKGFGETFFTISGLKKMGKDIYNHPFRFAASMSAGALSGAAAGNLASNIASYVHPAKVISHGGRISIKSINPSSIQQIHISQTLGRLTEGIRVAGGVVSMQKITESPEEEISFDARESDPEKEIKCIPLLPLMDHIFECIENE